jgi:hypothetical protein
MSRTLTVLFRRDPSRDRHDPHDQRVTFEGYQPIWPDGRPVAVGLDAFCTHGQRLLGLGRRLAGCGEKMIKLVCLPLVGREDELHRIPGYRVRRFYLERLGTQGRIHFLDGTPTTAVFDLASDDVRVLRWIGLTELEDGERQWFDLAATEVDTVIPAHVKPRKLALESVA